MRFISIFLVLLIVLTSDSYAQCDLVIEDSPKMVGLRLGMTAAEANVALGRAAKVKVKKDGQYSYFKSYLKKGKSKGVLTGARAFYVRFYKKRLYQIEIFYHRDHRWSNLESLISDYSTESAFPFQFWAIRHGYAKAKCDGFTVKADYILNPHLEISDTGVLAKLKK
jgi:hypothetical protein